MGECVSEFKVLDVKGAGALSPNDLLPLIVQLTSANYKSNTTEGRQQISKSGRRRGLSVRESVRGTCASRNKVDTLLLSLQSTSENLAIVLPLLPFEVRSRLESEELADECVSEFKVLDVKGAGALSPNDLLPLIVQLTAANYKSIGSDQIKKFVAFFDSNDDGVICIDEFAALVQYCIVVDYLESEEGKEAIEAAMIEENKFQDFVQLIQEDKERLWSVIPFLPEWLADHVTSEDFQNTCNQQFKLLDANNSGVVEPDELIHIIMELSKAHPLTLTKDRCSQFTKVFDVNGDGVIRQDEFIEFAQFLTVTNFLSNTAEGEWLLQGVFPDDGGESVLE